MCVFFFFFFQQKTAYEMRISDWSSDVCSSDLIIRIRSHRYATIDEVFEDRKYLSGMNGAPCTGEMKFAPRLDYQLPSDTHFWGYAADKLDAARFDEIGRASWRERVCQYV